MVITNVPAKEEIINIGILMIYQKNIMNASLDAYAKNYDPLVLVLRKAIESDYYN